MDWSMSDRHPENLILLLKLFKLNLLWGVPCVVAVRPWKDAVPSHHKIITSPCHDDDVI